MDLALLPWKLRYVTGRRIASTFRRLIVELSHRHTTVRFGENCYVGPGFQLDILGDAQFIVGNGVHFRRGFTCEIGHNGRVTIGDRCVFTRDTLIQCSTSIDILPDTWVGQAVIVDGNHRFRDPHTPVAEQGYDYRPLTIGPGALIYHHTTVVNSVGERGVVGAHAVITKPVPPYSLAVGIPAEVVEYFGPDAPATVGETT